MKNYKARVLTEGIFCSALALALVLVGVYFPAVSLLMTMLAGVPMMYLGMRRGVKMLVVALGTAVLLLFAAVGDIQYALLTGFMSFLPGMLIGYTLRKRWTFQGIIFAGGGAILGVLLLSLFLINRTGDGRGVETMLNLFLDTVRQGVDEVFLNLQGQLAMPEQELQNLINQTMDMMREMVFLYLPAFLIGFSVVVSYLLFMLGIFLLQRLRPVRIIYQPFWGFCAPRFMCYLGSVLFLVTSMSTEITIWAAALRNMETLLYAYMGVCGMSFLDYKLKKKLSSGYLRSIIYFAVFCVGYPLLGMLFQGFCVLGMLDGVLGFRMREEFGHE